MFIISGCERFFYSTWRLFSHYPSLASHAIHPNKRRAYAKSRTHPMPVCAYSPVAYAIHREGNRNVTSIFDEFRSPNILLDGTHEHRRAAARKLIRMMLEIIR